MNTHEMLDQKYLTLTCVGADGLPVQVSVFFVAEQDAILTVVTRQQAAILLPGCVTVAACSPRGRRIGADHFARITLLTEAETSVTRARVVRRYGLVPRRLTARRDDLVGLRISLVAEDTGPTLRLAA